MITKPPIFLAAALIWHQVSREVDLWFYDPPSAKDVGPVIKTVFLFLPPFPVSSTYFDKTNVITPQQQ